MLLPSSPQIACFDTAFHSALPDATSHFALPDELHAAGYRRFGFQGAELSASDRHNGRALGMLDSRQPRGSGPPRLSGRSANVLELEKTGDDSCRFALDYFCDWAARHAGSPAVALGGVEAVAFTGASGRTVLGCVRKSPVTCPGWVSTSIPG